MAGSTSPRHLAAASVCALLILNTGTAWGAGFFIREQSSTAQGNAFAGATAGADDISYMFFNPAGITRHDESQVLGAMSYIVPDSRAKDLEGTTAGLANIQGSSNSGDIGEDALVPALYALWVPTEDLRFGVGVNAPFGLTTDNEDDYVGRYHGTRSKLETININPVVAYKVTDWLSLGAGVQVQYVETQLQNAVDFGLILGLNAGGDPATDGDANLRGDDIGYGYNAGILLEPFEGTRIGFSYRSEVNHSITGNVDVNTPAGSGGSSSATAQFTSPDIFRFGVHQDIGDEWALMADFSYTEWSDFEELRINIDGSPDNVTVEDWNNSIFVAIGATYKPKQIEGLTLRLGGAFDQSPIPDDTRTPRIPGNNRYWISTGVGYKPFEWAELTFSYTHVFVEDGDIDLSIADDPNNQLRGNLSGSYEQHIDIFTIGGRIIF